MSANHEAPPATGLRRTWKPVAAGVLSIVSGVFSLITAEAFFETSTMMGQFIELHRTWIFNPQIVTGIVAITGGIFAIRRRIWGLALAGAICALFPLPFSVPGILAIIFVSISKNEFAQNR